MKAALRRDRMLVAYGLLGGVALCWAYVLAGAGMVQATGDMVMPTGTDSWTPGHALVVLVMWAVRMAAMMLPSAAPMNLF